MLKILVFYFILFLLFFFFQFATELWKLLELSVLRLNLTTWNTELNHKDIPVEQNATFKSFIA